jgi:23S rRNA (cytidine1920-2'-O)/16S rRNA (cytidine1409-2'-O)-methyltransferase
MKRPTERADVALVALGLAPSREKAQALILSGCVRADGRRVTKPSECVTLNADRAEGAAPSVLTVDAPPPYVGRGGYKLAAALDAFSVSPEGLICVDIGASTGGFTDVLLQRGASRVYCVDVGYGQLAEKLRTDPRVTVMDRTNARALTRERFNPPPSLAVMDVSFISIRLILPALRDVLGERGRVVTLIKPQFEAGREHVGKKGIVRDADIHSRVIEDISGFVVNHGWQARGVIESPIRGQTGNIEFLMDIRFAAG